MNIFCEYFKKDNFLLAVDARIKFLVTLACLIMALSYRGFVFPLSLISLCLFSCLIMQIPLKVFALRFSESFFIISIILFLKLFFSGSDILFQVEIMGLKISGYKDGLREGLSIAGRIFAAVSVVAVMGFSTPFSEFVAAMSWFKVPRGFTEVLMFAYRYIFVLLEDATVIYNAQKNRLGFTGVRRGLKSFGCLAGSLILKAFEKSGSITVAMIQRGYDGNTPRQRYKPLRLKEVLGAALFIFTLAFLWKM